jgi:hypothetical protein
MIAMIYHALFGVATLISLIDWRVGVVLCVLFDGIRDPVRKVTPNYPLIITLTVAGLWLSTFLGACMNEPRRLRLAREFYPQCRIVGWSLILALIPAGIVSLVSYADGWLLALMGVVSYLFPIVGLTIGIAYVRSGKDFFVPLFWYCLSNGIILIGAYLEFQKVPLVGLRGMGVHWVRHQTGYMIDLICGFYRSPDLLGLHAAHVLMFTTIIMMRARTHVRWFCFPLTLYSAWCLLICGRRKMIIMPFVFFAVVIFHGVKRGKMVFAAKAGAALLVVVALFVAFFPSETATNYFRFAETSQTEGYDRLSKAGIGGFIETIRQAGVMGYGLGTATQGGAQLAKHDKRTWQEDGISRFAAEFGIPGSFFVLCALYGLAGCVWKAIKSLPFDSRASAIQFDFLGLVGANAASFVVSHQAYSGDPSAIAIASLSLGYVLAIPLLGEEAREEAAWRSRSSAHASTTIAAATSAGPGLPKTKTGT